MPGTQPFPAHAVFKFHEPGGVAARSRQAVDEAGTDRIGDDREHNRHGAGKLQQGSYGRGAMGQNDVRRERNQFRRMSADFNGIPSGPARVDSHITAGGPAELLQRLQECRDPGFEIRIVNSCVQEDANAPWPLLLCSCRERPSRRTPNYAEKLSPPHPHPRLTIGIVAAQAQTLKDPGNVRFGSKADMCAAKCDVRFTPNSDRESRHPQTVMSALPPKADMCGAKRDVR